MDRSVETGKSKAGAEAAGAQVNGITRKTTQKEIAAKEPTRNGYTGIEQYNLRMMFGKDAWRS